MLKTPLEPNKYYHIFNHANGSENLFVKEDNYSNKTSKSGSNTMV